MGKASDRGLVRFSITNPRDFSTDKHKTADDTPYGGGEGMVLKADVLDAAWKHATSESGKRTLTIFMSPQGQQFDQNVARELAGFERLVLVCGHYEGIDERFIERRVDREISLGDYVLTGGELPALVVADVVSRWVPGVVGNVDSVARDSFENGLLKYPQYTRPRDFEGSRVPEILLSGDHSAIARWRQEQMQERTRRKRPDLWEKWSSEHPERSGQRGPGKSSGGKKGS